MWSAPQPGLVSRYLGMNVVALAKKRARPCRERWICSDYLADAPYPAIRQGAKEMKFILMMHATKADFDFYVKWSKKDLQANVAFMQAFNKELKDSGVFVSTEGLAFPDQAKTVHAGDDGIPITDGVFPESKEFLAGYWIVDVENPQQAYEIAARASSAPGGRPGTMPIEVRQVLSGFSDLGL
jgi:hypothetical protein